MKKERLLLDTNVLVDSLLNRQPFSQSSDLLLAIGMVGEVELWVSASQMTDLLYILTDGGKPALFPKVAQSLREIRRFVNVCPVGVEPIDEMLSTTWKDPEDFLLFKLAMDLHADAIITRNAKDFEHSMIRICNAQEYFSYLKSEHGIEYEEVSL